MKFTIQEFKNYLMKADSLGDAVQFLSEEKILGANQTEIDPIINDWLKHKHPDHTTNNGDKVLGIFSEGEICNGYDSDKIHAKRYIRENVEYTIDFVDVGSWYTKVYLEEFPCISFNSVHFKVVV